MLFYLSKVVQASGLLAIAIGFVTKFPQVMDVKLWGVGLLIFIFGWGLERYFLKYSLIGMIEELQIRF